MTSRRLSAESRAPFAAILSAGVFAPINAERAAAMSPKTFSSCCANPFTVSTRLGIKSARRCSTTSTCAHDALTASRFTTIWLRRPTYMLPKISAISSRMTMAITVFFMRILLRSFFFNVGFVSLPAVGRYKPYDPLEILLFDALPFAFGSQSIQRMNHNFDRFQILAVGANDFRDRMVVAKLASQFKNPGLRAGQFLDAAIERGFIKRRNFAKNDQEMPQQHRNTGNRLRVDFAKLCFVIGRVQKMCAQFLQRGAQLVLQLNAMKIHGHFNAFDRIVAEKHAVVLADIQM